MYPDTGEFVLVEVVVRGTLRVRAHSPQAAVVAGAVKGVGAVSNTAAREREDIVLSAGCLLVP